MADFFHHLHLAASANLTISEIVILLAMALICWIFRKKCPWLSIAYSIFLILYITLLRRAPGFDEHLRLHLKLLSNARVLAENLLNLLLFVPLGYTLGRKSRKVIPLGFSLSVFCEVVQYITGRGWGDVNDVLFNTLGTAVGLWIALKQPGNT